jgi:cold shock CspA family protein
MSNRLGRKLQKWNPRGFVFATRDDGGTIFVHAHQLQEAGIDTDTGVFGLRITFDIGVRGDGKSYAFNVRTDGYAERSER